MIDVQSMLKNGITMSTSGTTGTPKRFFHSPTKLLHSNASARRTQHITPDSRVYTVCKIEHAGGLLAQTLPALEVGAHVDIDSFNAYKFVRVIKDYTHTHLTPAHARAVMKTRSFETLDLTGVWVTCGSDRVDWDIIRAFVSRGATFMVNWGMTEVGPCAINTTFRTMDQVDRYRMMCPPGFTLLGDNFEVEWKIGVAHMLHIKGPCSVFNDTWYNTGDSVVVNNGVLFFRGRA